MSLLRSITPCPACSGKEAKTFKRLLHATRGRFLPSRFFLAEVPYYRVTCPLFVWFRTKLRSKLADPKTSPDDRSGIETFWSRVLLPFSAPLDPAEVKRVPS